MTTDSKPVTDERRAEIQRNHDDLNGMVFIGSGKSFYASAQMATHLQAAHNDRRDLLTALAEQQAKCERLRQQAWTLAEAVQDRVEWLQAAKFVPLVAQAKVVKDLTARDQEKL